MRVCVILLLCSALVSRGASQELPRAAGVPSSDLGDSLAQQSNRNETVTEERTVSSEQRNDGIHHKVTITKKIRYPYTVHVEKRIPKIIEVPVDKPFNVYVPKPYPVIVEKKVPYEIKVPQPQPYTVDKKVPYPVKVLVDKPYTLHVPKPYPVEVDKKYEFTVEKKVPVEVKVPVERPYPVHVIVEKEVRFPVETKVPVPVKVPHDKPIPIHVTKHVPVHVDKPVPYTVEKVSTYPVRVPFRIPIKMHYPEGGSVEQHYATHFDTQSHPEHNLEWSEAMASVTKAIRGLEQNQQGSFVRQGFTSSRYRQPQHFPSSAKVPFHYTAGKYRPTTKLQAVHAPQQSYKVTEGQSERDQTAPFLVKPETEVLVPQIILADAPPNSGSPQSNSVWAQGGRSSFEPSQYYQVFNNSKAQSQAWDNAGNSFTVSQVVHHGQQQVPQYGKQQSGHHAQQQGVQPGHKQQQVAYQGQQQLGHHGQQQAVQPGQKQLQAAYQGQQQKVVYYGQQHGLGQINQLQGYQSHSAPTRIQIVKGLPQSNYIQPQPTRSSEPKSADKFQPIEFGNRQPFMLKSEGQTQWQNHRVPSATYLTSPHSTSQTTKPEGHNQVSSSRPAGLTFSYHQPSPEQAQPLFLPTPILPSNGAHNDGFSSSYVGSKTVLEGQELSFTSSVQHDQSTKRPETNP